MLPEPELPEIGEPREWFAAEWPNIQAALDAAHAAARHDAVWRLARVALDLAISRELAAQEGTLRLTLGRVLRAKGETAAAREQLTLAARIYERVDPKLLAEVRAELATLS